MGKKVNPHSFRLGVNKAWNSKWYSPKKGYATMIHADMNIRNLITKKAKSAGVDKIEIVREADKLTVNLTVGKPGIVIGRAGKDVDALKADLAKLVGKPVNINILEVANPYLSATLVAQNIAEAMEKRILPKVIMSQQIEKIMSAGALGAKIMISGLGKKKQVGSEKKEAGRVPLSTIRANIDYAKYEAKNLNEDNRKAGIRVWINLGEKMGFE